METLCLIFYYFRKFQTCNIKIQLEAKFSLSLAASANELDFLTLYCILLSWVVVNCVIKYNYNFRSLICVGKINIQTKNNLKMRLQTELRMLFIHSCDLAMSFPFL